MNAELKAFLSRVDSLMTRMKLLLPEERVAVDWGRVKAARWQVSSAEGYLSPLQAKLDLTLQDLLKVERQRELLVANTQQFVRGFPANHVLLWGARGTGKSSLVRALLAEYAEAGLRLIEIERDHLADLPRLLPQLAGQPHRFILFCDDLSFEAGEMQYRVLKTVLDGSLDQAPDNVLLYATSNRRHLLPERQSDNHHWQTVDGEVHPSEAVEDKIALSDRFGLWLSFYSFGQDDYLTVVRHWINCLASTADLQWDWDESLEKDAVSWATSRGNRNGRCAYQFARHWVGLRMLAGMAKSASPQARR